MSKGQRQRSHNHSADHGRDGHDGSSSKALQRVEKARALYVKSEHRVATARLRLMQAEEKLARRASRLSTIEDALAATATAVATDQAPTKDARAAAAPIEAHVAAAPMEEPTTPEQAADMVELAALATTPHTPELHANGTPAADTTVAILAAVSGTASSGSDGTSGLSGRSQGQREKGRSEPRPRNGGRRKPASPSSESEATPMPEES